MKTFRRISFFTLFILLFINVTVLPALAQDPVLNLPFQIKVVPANPTADDEVYLDGFLLDTSGFNQISVTEVRWPHEYNVFIDVRATNVLSEQKKPFFYRVRPVETRNLYGSR